LGDVHRPCAGLFESRNKEAVMRAARILAVGLGLGLGACQTGTAPPVYLDPASNLGVQSGANVPPPPTTTPIPTGGVAAQVQAQEPPRDAQGQPNDEFDGQSWIEYRRRRGESEARPRPRPAIRYEAIPMLPGPGEAELDPSMYDPRARR
jgi:hypothetical protein